MDTTNKRTDSDGADATQDSPKCSVVDLDGFTLTDPSAITAELSAERER